MFLACALVNALAACAIGQNQSPAAGRKTTVHWDKVPLRDALARLENTLDVPIFTDRRVDPNQRISVDIADAASDEVLNQTAAAASLGMSRLGRLVYFGPASAAGQLRTLATIGDEAIAKLPDKMRSAAKVKQSLNWSRLAEPRQLVTKLVEGRGLRLAGAERIPHDLWPAGSLPDLSLAEQLAVILIGFDLTFAVELREGVIKVVPISGPVTIRRHYRLPRDVEFDQLKERFRGIELRDSRRDVIFDGSAEDHERLGLLLRRQRELVRSPPVPGKTRKLLTLRIEQQPLRNVLEQVGQRLGWTIEIDDAAIQAAGVSLDERVTFAVENVDEDALLTALLRPAGLDHERDGNNVRVMPRGKK
jgi:hypothetical protein